MPGRDERLIVGRIVGLLGIKGWLKIESFTEPRENIESYSPWWLRTAGQTLQLQVDAVRQHGRGLAAKLAGIDSRDEAAGLVGNDIEIDSSQLPELADGDLYWRDLIGLTVYNRQRECLGRVRSLLETGANDVLVVEHMRDDRPQELLIPFLREQVILAVDRQAGEILVDWEIDY